VIDKQESTSIIPRYKRIPSYRIIR
jgi:hypothetical protein